MASSNSTTLHKPATVGVKQIADKLDVDDKALHRFIRQMDLGVGRGTRYAKYGVDGDQHQKLIGLAWTARTRPPEGHFSRRMAEHELDALLSDLRRQAAARPVVRTDTFGAACEGWLASRRHHCASTTWQDYRRSVDNHFLPTFGSDTPIAGIRSEGVENFQAGLTMAPVSARKLMVLLNGVFRWAMVKKNWIAANPCDRLDRIPVKSTGEFQVLKPEEVMAVVRALEG